MMSNSAKSPSMFVRLLREAEAFPLLIASIHYNSLFFVALSLSTLLQILLLPLSYSTHCINARINSSESMNKRPRSEVIGC